MRSGPSASAVRFGSRPAPPVGRHLTAKKAYRTSPTDAVARQHFIIVLRPCATRHKFWPCPGFTRDALSGRPLRNRMQAIKKLCGCSRICRGRPKGRPAVNRWKLCLVLPNGRPTWSPLQLLGTVNSQESWRAACGPVDRKKIQDSDLRLAFN